MVKVKKDRAGKAHYLPVADAYTAICGVVSAFWLPIRDDVTLFGECKRCAAIKAKAQSAQAVS